MHHFLDVILSAVIYLSSPDSKAVQTTMPLADTNDVPQVELAFAVPEHTNDLTTLRNKLSTENFQCSEIVKLTGANAFTVSRKDFDRARKAAVKIIQENSLSARLELDTGNNGYELWENGKKAGEKYF